MLKSDFLKLVRKHLKGTATAEEEQLLLSYYSLFENEPDVLAQLNEQQKADLKEDIRAAIWQNIEDKTEQPVKVKRFYSSYLKYAAAILLFAAVSAAIFVIDSKLNKPITYQNITPKAQNTLIHLPDGSTVVVMKSSKVRYASDFNESRR